MYHHAGGGALALFPNRFQTRIFIEKIRNIIKRSFNLSAHALIALLNPLIFK